MNLLILTQKVSSEDPVLGFFHKWLEELSNKFNNITVICLEEGNHALPDNVKVFSLGKDKSVSRVKYVINFYKYIWREKSNYDAVFVHMNQEYVLLGGVFWKIFGKKIYLWRNHPEGNFITRLAVLLSDKVFCTSPQSFTAKFKKTEIMPVGIDTDIFKPSETDLRLKHSILSLGRISPIKNIDKLIEAAILLDKEGIDFRLDVVGSPTSPSDEKYQKFIFQKAENLVAKGKVEFMPAISQIEAAKMYQSHEIFVNLTPSGSMDKTILEAVACGCLPVVINSYFKDWFEIGIIQGDQIEETSKTLKKYLFQPKKLDAIALYEYVEGKHSLRKLVDMLIACIN